MSVPHRCLTLLVLGSILGGCRSADAVRRLPLDDGLRARYARSADEVDAALVEAMAEAGAGDPVMTQGEDVAEGDGFVLRDRAGPTYVVLASNGAGLFSWGDFTRAVVHEDSVPGRSEVRALGRPRYLLDWSGRTERRAPRVLEALDRRLGSDAIMPYDGMRIRARKADGSTVVGRTRSGPSGTWRVVSDSDASPMVVDDITELAVHRGSYTHRAEWATALAVAGFVIGLVRSADCPPGYFQDLCELDRRLSRANLGTLVGAVAGVLIGSLHRTDVWSPMAPAALTR